MAVAIGASIIPIPDHVDMNTILTFTKRSINITMLFLENFDFFFEGAQAGEGGHCL
jgi:hypothetical protein